jgi:hypothetical protein
MGIFFQTVTTRFFAKRTISDATGGLTRLRHCEIGFAFQLVNVERGRLSKDVISESFCSGSPRIARDGFSSYMTREGVMVWWS